MVETRLTGADKFFYSQLINILQNGSTDENPRPHYLDGTPAHTKFVTDIFEKYDADTLPITQLRKIAWKSGIRETLWIYQDQTTDLNLLEEKYSIEWWSSWRISDENTIGQVYGNTVKRYDLVNNLLKNLKEDPFGRRHIINLWQEKDFTEPHGLKPCAYETMWSVRKNKEGRYVLDCFLNQRSSDYIMAGHINLCQYKALQMMFAKHLGYEVGTFSRHTMNLHVYDRHIPSAKKIITEAQDLMDKERNGNAQMFLVDEPKLILDVPDGTNFYDIKESDFKLENYNPIKYTPKLDLEIAI